VEPGGAEVLHFGETGLPHQFFLVPDRDRTAYSLTPGFKAAGKMARQLTFQDDIGELEPAAWFQDAVNFGEEPLLVGREVDSTVRDNHVEAIAGIRYGFTVNLFDLDIFVAGPAEIIPGPSHHLFGEVDSADPAGLADQPPGDNEVETGSAADIEDCFALFDGGDSKGVAHPAEG